MKISYAINNLRSLDEMEPVELRPITILVGANSSGKSTFLRSLSLLRQSLEEDTDEPILWYGKRVDFGDFLKSVREKKPDNEISFEFDLNEIQIDWINPMNTSIKNESKTINNVKYKIFLKNNGEYTFVNRVILNILDYNLVFTIKNNNNIFDCYLNDSKIDKFISDNFYLNFNDILTPFKISRRVMTGETFQIGHYILRETNSSNIFSQFIFRVLDKSIEIPVMMEIVEDVVRIVNSYPLNEKSLDKLYKTFGSKNKFLYEALLDKKNEKILSQINLHCALHLVFRIYEQISADLQKFFLASTRLGPSRDLTRSYRYQEFDVSELTEDGRNLPMFLSKLKNANELQEFSKWVYEFLGYEIEIVESVDHFYINLLQEGLSVNVSDTGYGISQMLPVLAQIWMHSIRKIKNTERRNGASDQLTINTISMEQPELHLHPKIQARIADALVSALNHNTSSTERPMFIIETHSEPLISRLGELIENQKVSERDVQVVLFSKRDNKPNSTEVKTATFNNIGALSNWPYGFFNY